MKECLAHIGAGIKFILTMAAITGFVAVVGYGYQWQQSQDHIMAIEKKEYGLKARQKEYSIECIYDDEVILTIYDIEGFPTISKTNSIQNKKQTICIEDKCGYCLIKE